MQWSVLNTSEYSDNNNSFQLHSDIRNDRNIDLFKGNYDSELNTHLILLSEYEMYHCIVLYCIYYTDMVIYDKIQCLKIYILSKPAPRDLSVSLNWLL